MAAVPRGWQLATVAVTFGMALPLICGDLVVVGRAVAVLGHVVAALP